jgi:hypothetical protein
MFYVLQSRPHVPYLSRILGRDPLYLVVLLIEDLIILFSYYRELHNVAF